MVIRTLTVAVASVLLAACTVGPDYVRPSLPAVDQFSNSASPQVAQEAAPAMDLEFWRSFGDPVLEQLVDEALLSNHDLRIALAHYDRANALQQLMYLNTNKFASLTIADRTGIVFATTDSRISSLKDSPTFAETRAWVETLGLGALAIGLTCLRLAESRQQPALKKVAWALFAITLVAMGMVFQRDYLR